MATFQNQATLSYNGIVTNSNVTTGELIDVLSATKIAVKNSYSGGEDITYIISILNSGSTAFNGLTVSDNLGAYQFNTQTLTPLSYIDGSVHYYTNGALQAAPSVEPGPPLTITGIDVPANGNATIVYAARTNQFAPLATGSSIENTVTVNGGGLSTPITAVSTVQVSNEAELTISKSVSPMTVTDNSEITYTFVIQNTGNTAAETGVVVTDLFNPVLSDLSVTFNDQQWSVNTNYTYDAVSGLFTTAANQITVPAASYTQDSATGSWIMTPGVSVLTVTGRI